MHWGRAAARVTRAPCDNERETRAFVFNWKGRLIVSMTFYSNTISMEANCEWHFVIRLSSCEERAAFFRQLFSLHLNYLRFFASLLSHSLKQRLKFFLFLLLFSKEMFLTFWLNWTTISQIHSSKAKRKKSYNYLSHITLLFTWKCKNLFCRKLNTSATSSSARADIFAK